MTPLRRRMATHPVLDDDDPLSGMVNLFDLAIVFAVGLAVASLYIVYIAPLLFAEILVDAALSYALFRYLRGQDPEHWLASTFRRTAVPFAVTALFLCVTGAAMSAYAPGAKSIGQVVKHASTVRLTK